MKHNNDKQLLQLNNSARTVIYKRITRCKICGNRWLFYEMAEDNKKHCRYCGADLWEHGKATKTERKAYRQWSVPALLGIYPEPKKRKVFDPLSDAFTEDDCPHLKYSPAGYVARIFISKPTTSDEDGLRKWKLRSFPFVIIQSLSAIKELKQQVESADNHHTLLILGRPFPIYRCQKCKKLIALYCNRCKQEKNQCFCGKPEIMAGDFLKKSISTWRWKKGQEDIRCYRDEYVESDPEHQLPADKPQGGSMQVEVLVPGEAQGTDEADLRCDTCGRYISSCSCGTTSSIANTYLKSCPWPNRRYFQDAKTREQMEILANAYKRRRTIRNVEVKQPEPDSVLKLRERRKEILSALNKLRSDNEIENDIRRDTADLEYEIYKIDHEIRRIKEGRRGSFILEKDKFIKWFIDNSYVHEDPDVEPEPEEAVEPGDTESPEEPPSSEQDESDPAEERPLFIRMLVLANDFWTSSEGKIISDLFRKVLDKVDQHILEDIDFASYSTDELKTVSDSDWQIVTEAQYCFFCVGCPSESSPRDPSGLSARCSYYMPLSEGELSEEDRRNIFIYWLTLDKSEEEIVDALFDLAQRIQIGKYARAYLWARLNDWTCFLDVQKYIWTDDTETEEMRAILDKLISYRITGVFGVGNMRYKYGVAKRLMKKNYESGHLFIEYELKVINGLDSDDLEQEARFRLWETLRMDPDRKTFGGDVRTDPKEELFKELDYGVMGKIKLELVNRVKDVFKVARPNLKGCGVKDKKCPYCEHGNIIQVVKKWQCRNCVKEDGKPKTLEIKEAIPLKVGSDCPGCGSEGSVINIFDYKWVCDSGTHNENKTFGQIITALPGEGCPRCGSNDIDEGYCEECGFYVGQGEGEDEGHMLGSYSRLISGSALSRPRPTEGMAVLLDEVDKIREWWLASFTPRWREVFILTDKLAKEHPDFPFYSKMEQQKMIGRELGMCDRRVREVNRAIRIAGKVVPFVVREIYYPEVTFENRDKLVDAVAKSLPGSYYAEAVDEVDIRDRDVKNVIRKVCKELPMDTKKLFQNKDENRIDICRDEEIRYRPVFWWPIDRGY